MDRVKSSFQIRASLWWFFLVFALAHSLLAYFSFSYLAKGWVFIFGLLIPGALLLLAIPPAPPNKKDLFSREFLKVEFRHWGIWFFALGISVFLRFYKLTSYHLWPTGDEGLHGFFAIDLARKWDWQFFYTVGEHPPLLIWVLSFFFKHLNNSFFNLWFPPAFLSALALPLGYFAARFFFSRSLSLLCGWLMAFSFWPLYFGRFCHQGIFIPFWELSCFCLLGLFLKGKKKTRKKIWLLVLGLWTGLGSLTFPAWGAVLLLVALTLGWFIFQESSEDSGSFFLFGAALLTGLAPFIGAALREGYGHHLLDASAASGWFSKGHAFRTHISYLSGLFWGNLQEGASYGPVWGGILNPLLSSCFLIGLLEFLRNWKSRLTQWMFFAFFLSLLPALLASDYVEFNRIIAVMPFLLLTVAAGIQKLLVQTADSKRLGILAVLLAGSLGLDLFHLWKPSSAAASRDQAPLETRAPDQNVRAYQILNATRQERGAGLLFTDFLLLSHNHSLFVATYPFNAASNPKLDPGRASWAAILTNAHYGLFLQKRFPVSRWNDIGKDLSDDGGLTVGIIPITPANRAVFMKWVEVHRYFHHLNREAEDILNNSERYGEALRHLPEGYAVVKGDPWLESVFGEWIAQYHFSPTYRENVRAIQTAIQKGYPTAQLYYKLGNFLWLGNQTEKAKEAYRMACRLKPDYTLAGAALREMEKTVPGR